MSVRKVKQVLVTDRGSWGKWPHTGDTNFAPVLAMREHTTATHEGQLYDVESTLFPAYACYSAIGFSRRHPAFPNINNTILPPKEVTSEQLLRLVELAKDHEVIVWDHAVQCFPPVAQFLKSLFKCAILIFADDCPGSSNIKTFPVAKYFHAYYHQMGVWSYEKGECIDDMYRGLGVERCYFKANSTTMGFSRRLVEAGFDLEAKAARIEQGTFPLVDLVYVGGFFGNTWRLGLLRQAGAVSGGVVTRFYGVGCRDGVLQPREPVERISEPLVSAYQDALFGVNPQQSSLFNTRLMDLWYAGVAQLIYDPHHELERQGFVAGEHYIPFDGSAAGLYTQVRAWKARPKELAALIRRAHKKAVAYNETENTMAAVFGHIYHDYHAGKEVV
jgi:hypothetical protein